MPNAVAGSSGLNAEITHSCWGAGSLSKEGKLMVGLDGELGKEGALTSLTGEEGLGEGEDTEGSAG